GHARDDGKWNGAQDDGRQDEVAQRVEEGALLAGDQAVDQHEPGHLRIIIFDEIDPARHGGQAQSVRHDENEDQAPPEDRHGIAGEGDTNQRMAIEAAAARGGDDARRNADKSGKEKRADGKLDGGGEKMEEFMQYRILGDDRNAEIPMQEAPDIVEELLPDRL